MKNLSILFGLTFLISIQGQATVKTSVVDGNWYNPSTWSPSGVPMNEDTVIINTHVIADAYIDVGINWLIINPNDSLTGDSIFGLHGNLKVDGVLNIRDLAVGDGSTTINNGIIKGEIYATGNSTYTNNGCIYSDSLMTSETNFTNDGVISNNQLMTSGGFNNNGKIVLTQSLFTSGTFNNNNGGGIEVGQSFSPSGTFTNHTGGIMVLADFTTGVSMTNDGEISCNNWTHGSGTMTGTGGKICIAGCFINNAAITGTLDICDATPSMICDINVGSIAPTVTMCAVSPCAGSIGSVTSCSNPVGIEQKEDNHNDVRIFPNPSAGKFKVDYNLEEEVLVQVFDMAGKLIFSTTIDQNNTTINLDDKPEGIYHLLLRSDNSIQTKKLVIAR